MPQETRKIAVLTGDIVGSTALGAEKLERAMTALAECAEVQADWHGESLRFTRNRGDGWQVVLAKPEMALRSALAFRAALKAEADDFDSYFGIAHGDAPNKFANDLNMETGPIFVQSGETLERVKNSKVPVRVLFAKNPLLAASAALADHISQGWTSVQAKAMYALLDPMRLNSFTDIARKLGKSRQTVTKSLEAAGHIPIMFALADIEKLAEQ